MAHQQLCIKTSSLNPNFLLLILHIRKPRFLTIISIITIKIIKNTVKLLWGATLEKLYRNSPVNVAKMVIDKNFDISQKFCKYPILGHSSDCYQVFWTVLHSSIHKDLIKIFLFWVTHLCRVSFECVGKLISRVHCWAWYCGILLSINVWVFLIKIHYLIIYPLLLIWNKIITC